MIAIHGGAGDKFKGEECKICAKAVRNSGGDLIAAIATLERDAAFNCGYGSNLTASGRVECEAGYMTSRRLAFGSVGAVTNCVTPSVAARALAVPFAHVDGTSCTKQWTLIPPLCLVGDGANRFCEKIVPNVSIVSSNERLQSEKAKRNFTKASTRLGNQHQANSRLDTVGGVSIHPDGMVESCVSSGGLILKRDGRLGHCVQFGAGIWSEQRGHTFVGVSLSGCGEALLRTRLAERLADECFAESSKQLNNNNDGDEMKDEQTPGIENEFENIGISLMRRLHAFLIDEFVHSTRLFAFPVERRLVGGLIMVWRRDSRQTGAELFVFHNTPQFVFAYSTDGGKSVRRQKSTLQDVQDMLINSFIL